MKAWFIIACQSSRPLAELNRGRPTNERGSVKDTPVILYILSKHECIDRISCHCKTWRTFIHTCLQVIRTYKWEDKIGKQCLFKKELQPENQGLPVDLQGQSEIPTHPLLTPRLASWVCQSSVLTWGSLAADPQARVPIQVRSLSTKSSWEKPVRLRGKQDGEGEEV